MTTIIFKIFLKKTKLAAVEVALLHFQIGLLT